MSVDGWEMQLHYMKDMFQPIVMCVTSTFHSDNTSISFCLVNLIYHNYVVYPIISLQSFEQLAILQVVAITAEYVPSQQYTDRTVV